MAKSLGMRDLFTLLPTNGSAVDFPVGVRIEGQVVGSKRSDRTSLSNKTET
jgi:hypothetical protein